MRNAVVGFVFLQLISASAVAQWGGDGMGIPGAYAGGGQYFMQPGCGYGDQMHPSFRKIKESEDAKFARKELEAEKKLLRELQKQKSKYGEDRRKYYDKLQKGLNVTVSAFTDHSKACESAFLDSGAVPTPTETSRHDDFCNKVASKLPSSAPQGAKDACKNAARFAIQENGNFKWKGMCGGGNLSKSNTGGPCFDNADLYKDALQGLEQIDQAISDQTARVEEKQGLLDDALAVGGEEYDDVRSADTEGCRGGDCQQYAKRKIDPLPIILGTALGGLTSYWGYSAAMDANKRNQSLGYPSGPSPYISAISAGYPFFYGGVMGGIYGGMGAGSFGCSPMMGGSAWGPGGYFGANPYGFNAGVYAGAGSPYGMFNPGYFGGPFGYANPYGMGPMGIGAGLYAGMGMGMPGMGMGGMFGMPGMGMGMPGMGMGMGMPGMGMGGMFGMRGMGMGMPGMGMGGMYGMPGMGMGMPGMGMGGMYGMPGMGMGMPGMGMGGMFPGGMGGAGGMGGMYGMGGMQYQMAMMQNYMYAMQDYYSKLQLTMTYQQRIAELNQLMWQIWSGGGAGMGMGMGAGMGGGAYGGIYGVGATGASQYGTTGTGTSRP
ncbi:MAG: hypothetical protein IT289_05390 [Oligoflexia bacterium]|nr:hypothetical protein [Oligoflexia bacterium]